MADDRKMTWDELAQENANLKKEIGDFAQVKNLVNDVARMRKAQKNYFKDRTQELLIKSKELESKVDNEISSLILKK